MNPLQPGSRLGPCVVTRVLKFRPSGGTYLVRREGGESAGNLVCREFIPPEGTEAAGERLARMVQILAAQALVLVVLLAGWCRALQPTAPPEAPDYAAYAACGRTVEVVDLLLERVVDHIDAGGRIHHLAGSPDGRLLFATLAEGRLVAIDLLKRRVAASLPLPRDPREIAVDPLGSRLFVAHPDQRLVSALEVERGASGVALRATSLLATGQPPLYLARAGTRLFVAARTPDRITTYRGDQVLEQAPTVAPGPLACSPDGSLLGVLAPDSIGLLEAGSLQVRSRLPLAPEAEIARLLFTPDGSELWGVDRSGSLRVYDHQGGRTLATLRLPGEPGCAAFSWRGDLLVALEGAGRIALVDPFTRTVRARIPVGSHPTCVWSRPPQEALP